jgi:predicted  nucleic acid-binding Zn-ribbon protein
MEEEIETLKNEKGELQRSWDMQQLEIMKLTSHVQDLNKKIASAGGREVSIKEIMNRA